VHHAAMCLTAVKWEQRAVRRRGRSERRDYISSGLVDHNQLKNKCSVGRVEGTGVGRVGRDGVEREGERSKRWRRESGR